jgi:uroporphyrinogen decarboxylase
MGYEYFLYQIYDNPFLIERLMDIILEHQVKVVETVCQKYGEQCLFFLFNDDIAHNSGLAVRPEQFGQFFIERMRTLISPTKKLNKKVVMHTDGKMDAVIPLLLEVGIDGVHPCEPESNDIFSLKEKWYGKMILFGNISTVALAYGRKEDIDEEVRWRLKKLGPEGGYVFGSSTSIMEGIPPENFLTMIQTVQQEGRYPINKD